MGGVETDISAPVGAIFAGIAAAAPQKGGEQSPNFKEAVRMEADNRDADTIRAATGFHRDQRGNWRFEISDDQAKWKRVPFGRNYKLSEVLDHPTLFKVYPQLKDLSIRADKLNGFVGWYKPKSDEGPGEIVLDMSRMNRHEIFQTLLHEVQHAVQDEEGILEGYRMRTPDTLRNELALRLEDLETKGSLTPAETKQLTELQEAEQMIMDIEKRGKGGLLEANLKHFAPYSTQFHEAEAYDTMARQKLTPAERRVVPLNPPTKPKWSDFYKMIKLVSKMRANPERKDTRKPWEKMPWPYDEEGPILFGDDGEDITLKLTEAFGGGEKAEAFVEHLKKTGRISTNIEDRRGESGFTSFVKFYRDVFKRGLSGRNPLDLFNE